MNKVKAFVVKRKKDGKKMLATISNTYLLADCYLKTVYDPNDYKVVPVEITEITNEQRS